MELSVTNLLMEDHDALTGSGVTAIDKNNAVPEKKNRLIGRSRKTGLWSNYVLSHYSLLNVITLLATHDTFSFILNDYY